MLKARKKTFLLLQAYSDKGSRADDSVLSRTKCKPPSGETEYYVLLDSAAKLPQ